MFKAFRHRLPIAASPFHCRLKNRCEVAGRAVDDLQDLGHSRFARQCLTQLLAQSPVFDLGIGKIFERRLQPSPLMGLPLTDGEGKPFALLPQLRALDAGRVGDWPARTSRVGLSAATHLMTLLPAV